MKKGIFFAACIMIASLAANAQGGKKDRFANVSLTPQQRTSIDSVKKVYDRKRAEIKKDTTLSPEASTEKVKATRKEQTAAINPFLTAEQKKQLKQEAKKAKKKD